MTAAPKNLAKDTLDSLCERRFRALFLALLLLSLPICAMGTGAGYFYDIDEAKYAAATYEMWSTGDLVRPMVNGMPRIEKPPLAYWVGLPFYAAVAGIGGPDSLTMFAARLPALFAAVLTVAGTVLLGRRMYGPAAGLLAGLMVQTCVVFHFLGVLFKVDIFFACCVTWMFYFLVCRFLGDRGRNVVLGALAATALAVLARGPFAFIPLAGFLAAGLVGDYLDHGGGALWPRIRSEAGFLALCVMAGSIPFLAWIAAAKAGGVDFFAGFSGQLLENTTVEHMSLWKRVLTTGFYGDTFFFVFVPWGAYLPAALMAPARGFRDRRTVFFLCSALVAVAVFSLLFKLKSHRYVLPLIPLATVFVCAWLVQGKRDGRGRTLFELCSYWLAGVAAFFSYRFFKGGYLPVNLYDPLDLKYAAVGPWLLASALAVAAALFLWGALRRKDRPESLILALSLGFCLTIGAYYATLPGYDPSSDDAASPSPGVSRLAADAVREVWEPGTLVVHSRSLGRVYPGFSFFQKEFGLGGTYSLALELTPALVKRALSGPDAAGELFDAAYPQGGRWPANVFFHQNAFTRTVLVLKDREHGLLKGAAKAFPGLKVRSVTGLSVKWRPETLYVAWLEEGEGR